MRMAGRFSRHIRGYAKAHNIPVIERSAGDRKHDIAEEHLAKTKVTHGVFLILVGRVQAPFAAMSLESVSFTSSGCDFWERIPEPNHKDTVIQHHYDQGNQKSAQAFSEP